MNKRESERRYKRWERETACAKEFVTLPSVKSAIFWHRMYRYDLYRRTHLHEQLRKKMEAARERVRIDAEPLQKRYRAKSIPLFGTHAGEALAYHVPWWKDVPGEHEVRGYRLRRRWWFWEGRDKERAEMWKLWHTAVVYLHEKSWPLSPAAIRRARAYMIAEHDRHERDRLVAEVAAERRAEELAQQQRRTEQAISEKAHHLLTELVPEIRVTKRMRKAQAFDVLVQLLEKSDVDPKTKEAIGRLRESVEVERPAASGLHRGAASPAPRHDGRRHQGGGGQAVPSADV